MKGSLPRRTSRSNPAKKSKPESISGSPVRWYSQDSKYGEAQKKKAYVGYKTGATNKANLEPYIETKNGKKVPAWKYETNLAKADSERTKQRKASSKTTAMSNGRRTK